MIGSFLESARSDKSVYITDVRNAFAKLDDRTSLRCLLALPDGRNVKFFEIFLPAVMPTQRGELDFVRNYVEAEVYNHLTTLGGMKLDIYLGSEASWIREIAEGLIQAFGINESRAERKGYARIINVTDRMLNALYRPSEGDRPKAFSINIKPATEFPGPPPPYRFQAAATSVFTDVTAGLQDRIICGLDIGGTDIKAVIAVNGKLNGLKEYDWNPATYGRAEELIEPIVAIIRLLVAKASLENTPSLENPEAMSALMTRALAKDAPLSDIDEAVDRVEAALGDRMIDLDAIGLCFPDVVVRNKVVGGEVPKTKGMRDNSALDFEEQFATITDLDERLKGLCREGGVVMNTNDGPMASFTAAVELAGSPHADQISAGVFAHTLGTDLGAGLVLGNGSVPEIPLEVYNLIVDLGSYPSRELPAADARSMNNTNTGIPGTLQRFTSQTGAFRLALKYFLDARPDLLGEIRDLGYLRTDKTDALELEIVPESPDDMRKPFLAHLMQLAVREHDDTTEQVFRDIGTFLAVVWQETEHILHTGIDNRYLFGRLVKVSACFDLMKEGAALREPQLKLTAADSGMAFTPLMKALDAEADYTVAQFGQAIGAVYFGNMGLL